MPIIPESIVLKRHYLIKGDEVWTGPYLQAELVAPAYFKGWSDNGPQWEPNLLVDVVSEFELDGALYRIQGKSVKIGQAQ